MQKQILIFFFLINSLFVFAQRGKSGAKTVSTSQIVNEYTALTQNANIGDLVVQVSSSTMNQNSRFGAALAPGDLVMIIQMQGAGMETNTWPSPWGKFSNVYNNCGNYEIHEVNSVPSSTSIEFTCGLTKAYTATGKTQIVRIPRYASLTVNSGGTLTCDSWDGTVGGVLALEVLGNTVVNSGGKIDVTGKGFRGGKTVTSSIFGGSQWTNTSSGEGAEKGESVYGSATDYDIIGGRYCKNAAANGGGGGDAHNCGGGGGANAGDLSKWTGFGVPDVTTDANYVTAWNLESANFATTKSSGGGKGGYSYSGSNAKNPLTLAPGNSGWNGDSRRNEGGFGGQPLDYSSGKIFAGGGGGGGQQNNSSGTDGAAGGGILYIWSWGSISGSGSFLAKGGDAANTTSIGTGKGTDGAGGGGGGGVVILNAVGGVSGVIASANGGRGGNQVITGIQTGEAEGPGGGGGGGYVAISSGAATCTASGGANGTTNSTGVNEFPPNGATMGGDGISNGSISNYYITAPDVTICKGASATLTAQLQGTPPTGTGLAWYSAEVGGTQLGTGTTYTPSPSPTTTTTYYVGPCPGFWRQPVQVIVRDIPTVTMSAPVTICQGQTTQLSASIPSPNTYAWATNSTLSSTTISNPIASPTATSTYIVTATDTYGCSNTGSVQIAVGGAISIGINPSVSTICSGQSVSITASGGTSYSWSNASSLNVSNQATVSASPTATTTYTVSVSDVSGCQATVAATVNVNSLPVNFAGLDKDICLNGNATLSPTSGGTSYAWSTQPGLSSNSIQSPVASPTVTTTYTLTMTDANSCSNTDQVVVTVHTPSAINAGSDQSICLGGSGIALSPISSGSSYLWSPATGLSAANISNPVANPTITTTYVLQIQDAYGCSATDDVVISITSSISVTAGASPTSVCPGLSAQLTAGGGSSYVWSNSAGSASSVSVTPGSTTTYVVTATDGGGCSGTASVTLTVNPVPLVNAGLDVTICTGSQTQLNASGAATYQWDNASSLTAANISNPLATPSSATTYTVTGTSTDGCSATDAVVVNIGSNLIPSISPDLAICNGQSATLTAGGGTTFVWSPATGLSDSQISNPVASPASTTIYSVTVSNGGCTGQASVTVTVNSAPLASAGADVSICAAGQAIFNAGGGVVYLWDNASTLSDPNIANPVAFPSNTTLYVVTVTDGNGCTATDDIQVTVNTINSADFQYSTACLGDSTRFLDISDQGVSPIVTWKWDFSDGGISLIQNPAHLYSPAGSYPVKLRVDYANGCADSVSKMIHVNVKPKADFSYSLDDKQVYFENLSGPAVNSSYWFFGNGGSSPDFKPNYKYEEPGTYSVVLAVQDGNGCSDTAVKVIYIAPEAKIFVPNAFTPNGDEINDYFVPQLLNVSSFTTRIYNRWGGIVFESSGDNVFWDGKDLKGEFVPQGVYVYILSCVLPDSDVYVKKGSIVVIY